MLSVKEIEKPDIEFIITYWLQSNPDFLNEMGVDLAKIASKNNV